MEQDNSSPVSPNAHGESQFYMTDIVVERTDIMDGDMTFQNLAELWVFGLPGSSGAKGFALPEVSPGVWKMAESIELCGDVDGIDCVVKGNEGEDIGFMHLDGTKLRTATLQLKQGPRRTLKSFDFDGVHFTLSFDMAEIPPEAISAANDLPLMLDVSSIEQAVLAQERLSDVILEDHNDLLGRFSYLRLGAGFSDRPSPSGDDISHLANTISTLQRFWEHPPVGHSKGPTPLTGCRSQLGSVLSDTDESHATPQEVVKPPPKDNEHIPGLITSLGALFAEHFERRGDYSDFAEAIPVVHRAVKLAPENHSDLPFLLSTLGRLLQARFKKSRVLPDISQSITAHQRAVSLTPEGDEDLPELLTRLGSSFEDRFAHTNNHSDIADAIEVQRRAVDLTPEGHPDLPWRINNLGSAFQCRFDHIGELSDSYVAVTTFQKAVELAPEGHTRLPHLLHDLGYSLQARFRRTGALSDISQSLTALHKAVQLTPVGHADLPTRLQSLETSYKLGSEHAGPRRPFYCDLSDISDLVTALREAVSLTPDGHRSLPFILSALGHSLRHRFDNTGEYSDIREALLAQQRAVSITPEGHADLPGRLYNLGDIFALRFEHSGEVSGIDDAIAALQKVIQLTPEGHVDLPGCHKHLGDVLKTRFDSRGNRRDLDESISHYKYAATSPHSSRTIILSAGSQWVALLCHDNPRSPDILHALGPIVDTFVLMTGLEKAVQGRYAVLQEIQMLLPSAVSFACSLDRPDRALEWLEQGRCRVWSQLNNLRTPLDELSIHHPELAHRIADTATRLESSGFSQESTHITVSEMEKPSAENYTSGYAALGSEWEGLLKTVGAIPGFEHFLKPVPCSTILQHLPDLGPVVIINVDDVRCDALALLAGLDEPLHIPLPNFSLKKAKRYRRQLNSQLRAHVPRARGEEANTASDGNFTARGAGPIVKGGTVDVLRRLGSEVVKPILDMLAISVNPSSGKVPPRIWWCPTGELSFLPLHAAGLYGESESDSVMDYVVSSYTPTITALTDRVKNNLPIDESVAGLFLTSQPNAPGRSPIPGTTNEVKSIHAMAKAKEIRVLMHEGADIAVDDCVKHMQDFSSVHLACHASQKADNPLQSRFFLHNGSLDLATVLQWQLKNADLAFLSACETSTGEEKLPDEAVHLAAGMLAAGYRRVVGTMWSIGDRVAQEVANDFYEYLWRHKGDGSDGRFDGSLSAYALHHAIQQLRLRQDSADKSEQSLLTWIPYVHFGY
ncbi:CHAT domain-containing protein [Ephemerocybe angulata]|uniref:CHAT domain-containing protein n=1 Tax=Ephemerocybe angulata TaxID=980116 RepID=A0A8H6IBS9_9AGAR|nr:CHAT domain-containing protein [Tulosesus angulatus]